METADTSAVNSLERMSGTYFPSNLCNSMYLCKLCSDFLIKKYVATLDDDKLQGSIKIFNLQNY